MRLFNLSLPHLGKSGKSNAPELPLSDAKLEYISSPSASGLATPSSLADRNPFDKPIAQKGFSPVRHIASSYKIRGPRPTKMDYEAVRNKDDDDGASDTYIVDEETIISQHPTPRRRPWLVCITVCSLTLLIVLLVLNVLLFMSSSVYRSTEDDPVDNIFSDWGRPGTGTENLAWYPTDFLRDVQPIPCHSHNDYWRRVPLFSALRAGCTGVEADVWLLNNNPNELFVGHDTAALQPNRTFRALYVDPLVRILERQNPKTSFYNETRRGVFDVNPEQTLTLLVDVKTAGAETLRKVQEQLEPLRTRGWLSTFSDGKVRYGPVTVVGTGNTPFDAIMQNSTFRDIFFDAPLDKLTEAGAKEKYNNQTSYYTSVDFSRSIGSVWFGGISDDQRQKIQDHVKAAHALGLKVRYWELPAWPIHLRNYVWEILVQEGVDYLNVDDLRGATKKDWSKKSWA